MIDKIFSKKNLTKNFYIGAYILLAAFVIAIFSTSIHPMNFDEAEFLNQARLIAEDGRPMDTEVWHPPLYIYLMAGFIKLFGQSDIVYRSFGFLFFIINLFILRILVKKIYAFYHEHRNDANKIKTGKTNSKAGKLHEKNQKTMLDMSMFIATAFYCLIPLFLQQALVIDIDTSVHATLVMLMLLTSIPILRARKNNVDAEFTDYALFSLAFAFALLSKLFTPIMFAGCLGFILLVGRNFKRTANSLVHYVAACILGFALFMILWYFIHLTIGGDYWFFFKLSFTRAASDLGIAVLFKRMLVTIHGAVWAALWLTLPLCMMFLMWVYDSVKKSFRKDFLHNFSRIDMLIILFFAVTFFLYNFWKAAGLSMKYMYPVYVLCLAPIAIFITKNVMDTKDDKVYVSSGSSMILASVFMVSGLILFANYLLMIIGHFTINYDAVARSFGSDHISPDTLVSGLMNIPDALSILGISLMVCGFIIAANILHKKRLSGNFILAMLAASAIFLYFAGDYLLGVVYVNPFVLAVAAVPFLLAWAIYLGRFISLRKYLMILLMLVFIYGITLSVNQSARADYQTQMSWTNYGERGFNEVVAELSGKCTTDGSGYTAMILRKDIGYYICPKDDIVPAIRSFIYDYNNTRAYVYHDDYPKNSWYDNNFLTDKKTGNATYHEIVSTRNVEYILIDPYTQSWDTREMLLEDYYLYKQIEQFEIYKRKE